MCNIVTREYKDNVERRELAFAFPSYKFRIERHLIRNFQGRGRSGREREKERKKEREREREKEIQRGHRYVRLKTYRHVYMYQVINE